MNSKDWMGMAKDIIKLLIVLAVLAAIIVGIHQLGMLEDNQAKYKHPITRPGASW
jgi:hypothetical protein